MKNCFFFLLVPNIKVREFTSFQGIRWSMKNTKGQTYSEPDDGMRFTAKISNVWAQTSQTPAVGSTGKKLSLTTHVK